MEIYYDIVRVDLAVAEHRVQLRFNDGEALLSVGSRHHIFFVKVKHF